MTTPLRHRLLAVLATLTLWPLLAARLVAAQAPAALTVTLHDEAGRPLPGVQVSLVAADLSPLGARATDQAGAASFADLPAGPLLVQVAGRTPSGRPLIQPGLDAQGVLVRLAGGPTRIDLRTQPDGLVLPDPETMAEQIARELPPDVEAPFPTIPLAATLAPRLPIAASDPLQAPSPAPAAPHPWRDPALVGRGILGAAALGGLLLALALRLQQRRAR